MVVVTRQRHDQRGSGFRKAVAQRCIFGNQHFGNAVDLGRGFARCGSRATCGQNNHITQLFGGSHGLCRGVHCQFAIVNFCKE